MGEAMTTVSGQDERRVEAVRRVVSDRVQAFLQTLPQAECQVENYFATGLYGRLVHVAKGTCFVGKIHLDEQLNLLLKGEMSLTTDGKAVRVKAPFILVGKPGKKRIGYAHEDSIWMTIRATELTDPERAFNELCVTEFSQYDSRKQLK
jgi:quercetin dioxygenase-like cupin family protein